MATRVKRTPSALHEQDLYLWAQQQADLLRQGRLQELDVEHLVEEIEDLAGSLRSSVRRRAITVMVHLLKLQHSPASDPRIGWRETIRTQRTRLLQDLTPSLRQHLHDSLPELYARARHDADGSLRDHGEHAAPTRSRPPAPMPSTRSRATGCPEATPKRAVSTYRNGR